MRLFYIVGHPPESKLGNVLLLKSHEWGGFNYLSLMRGVSIRALPGSVSFRIDQASADVAKADVLVCPFGWKVVSTKLADRLRSSAPGDVELVEVPIADRSRKALQKKFFAINALRVLDALSDTKTVYSPLDLGGTKPVLKPCVNATKIPDSVHVFRLKGDENRLLVDDFVKNALSEVPHDGLTFIPVETE